MDHRGNTCASGNHANVVAEIRAVDKIALGTLDANSITNFQARKDARDVAFLISLRKGPSVRRYDDLKPGRNGP